MYFIKDTFIDATNIRKMHHEIVNYSEYLVITYAFDEEHPTRIMVENHDDYLDVASRICDYIRGKEGL